MNPRTNAHNTATAAAARFRALAFAAALGALLAACAPPAVVFLSPDYHPAQVKKVALLDFTDYPSMAGSGQLVSGIFSQRLLQGGFAVVDTQVVDAALRAMNLQPGDPLDLDALRSLAAKLGVDALIQGQVTDFTDATDQTVVEDMTLEQDTPIYTHVDTVQTAPGGALVRTRQLIQTGTNVSTVDQPVEQTETVDAQVALSVRMIDAQSGEVLWSASDSEAGSHLNDASQSVSARILAALREKVKNLGS